MIFFSFSVNKSLLKGNVKEHKPETLLKQVYTFRGIKIWFYLLYRAHVSAQHIIHIF